MTTILSRSIFIIIDLEDRYRRNNLRIDGIAEGPNESWEQCEEQLLNVFKEKLDLDIVQVELAHRVRNKRNKDKKTRPKTIVCKFTNRKRKL